MKKTKIRLLALALTASVVLGLTGCKGADSNTSDKQNSTQSSKGTQDPFGKEPNMITITQGRKVNNDQKFLPGNDFDNNAYTKMMKEKFNIDPKFDWAAADYTQKVNLCIASNEMPDFLTNLTYTQFKALVDAGMAMDITQVFNDYASPYVKQVYNSNKEIFDSLVKIDGKMMGIPASQPLSDGLHVMWIRQDWLAKLGLQPPKTIDELEKVAEAFVTKDPDGNGKNDTIGLVGPSRNGKLYADFTTNSVINGFDPVFSAYKAFPGTWVKDKDGNAAYGSTQPETKQALTKLADLYKKGLIDKEMTVREDSGVTVAAGKAGMLFGPWWDGFVDIGKSFNNDQNANWQAYALPLAADGKYYSHMLNVSSSFVAISKKAKNPQAVIKMLNVFKDGLSKYLSEDAMKTEGDAVYFYHTFSMADGPEQVIKKAREVFDGKTTKEQVNKEFENYEAYAKQYFNNIMDTKLKPYNDMNIKNWDFSGTKKDLFQGTWSFSVGLVPMASGNYEMPKSLSYEYTKTMETKWSNLSKLEYETFSKIIMGLQPVDSFDAFVTRWKSEGGDTITKEIQATIKK